ncbi:MAG: DUF4349 domain-containing protein [Deltaproteobacteria bacterium]|nr:DUF4349 domain-containing protein [Deltaproteobacteria bacterium]
MNHSKPRPLGRNLFMGVLVLGVASCAAPGRHHSRLVASAEPMAAPADKDGDNDSDSVADVDDLRKTEGLKATQPTASGVKRLVIYNASLTLNVFDQEKALATARSLAERVGGWMQALTKERIVLRIPADKLRPLLAEIAKLGEVLERNIRAKDITQEVLDLRIRLKNAQRVLNRLTELLIQAKTVKDSVLIEKELGRVTEQIERFKGKLKYLLHHIAHSTLEVRVRLKTPWGRRRRKLPFHWLGRVGLDEILNRR